MILVKQECKVTVSDSVTVGIEGFMAVCFETLSLILSHEIGGYYTNENIGGHFRVQRTRVSSKSIELDRQLCVSEGGYLFYYRFSLGSVLSKVPYNHVTSVCIHVVDIDVNRNIRRYICVPIAFLEITINLEWLLLFVINCLLYKLFVINLFVI